MLNFAKILNSRANIGHDTAATGPKNLSRMTDIVFQSSAPVSNMRAATEMTSTVGSVFDGESDKRREIVAV